MKVMSQTNCTITDVLFSAFVLSYEELHITAIHAVFI